MEFLNQIDKLRSLFSKNFFKTNRVPKSLYDQALRTIVNSLGSAPPNIAGQIVLHQLKHTNLPVPLSDEILEEIPGDHVVMNAVGAAFQDPNRSKLKRLCMRYTPSDKEILIGLLKHKPMQIDLICETPIPDFINELNKYADNLRILKIGPTYSSEAREYFMYNTTAQLVAPKLRELSVGRTKYVSLTNYPIQQLVELNLSNIPSIGFTPLEVKMYHLTSLVLYNVGNLERAIPWICTLRNLQLLDMSQFIENSGVFEDPDESLTMIIASLPKLRWLDISGTNLAGSGVSNEACADRKTDIPGLAERVDRPLEFLGLYWCASNACQRHDIPADLIAGDANEKQILVAAMVYMNREEAMRKILSDLYNIYTLDNNIYVGFALQIVLKVLNMYLEDTHMQVLASATLFYIVKGKYKAEIRERYRQAIIETVCTSLEKHHNDETIMRNGYLVFCQFKTPSDVLFVYERIVFLIITGVGDGYHDGFVRRIAIYLLNSLACQVDRKQKEFLGQQGIIKKMLAIIRGKVNNKECDDVLEVAWSSMWNVTDETPANCEKFLDCDGLNYFLLCLQAFPEKDELLRNMMGLLGNVAEVDYLRARMMIGLPLHVFDRLLSEKREGIEVSYNAAGVLAHIASDGPDAWTIDKPTRERTLARMTAAINGWDLKTERNINYRSFKPILNLLQARHTPECQHWAVWALANLTTVYPDKYCHLLKTEGGFPLLKSLVEDERPYEEIKKLARCVLENCFNYTGPDDTIYSSDSSDSDDDTVSDLL